MKTEELESVLKQVIAKAAERKHRELVDGDWEDIDSGSWARIVRLMNICTACKDVMRLWHECKLDND